MPNLSDTLDTVVAIVVVLLVLSLMVQAIQSFIKKALRLKSREIERSLAELFEHVIDKAATPIAPTPAAMTATTTSTAITAAPDSASRELVNTVLGEFKKVGRYTRRGRLVLDSISKEDLLKILARIDSRHFYADYVTKFQAMYTDIEALEREVERLITNDPPLLQGAASARFAEMQAVISPLINDVRNIVSGNAVRTDALLGDLINLRRVKLDDALRLLAAAQESIAADLKEARAANNTITAATLQQLSASLATIAGIVGQLSQRMDAAFATLRAKLEHVETWYDTIMHGFEERYTRRMRDVAIYISICVVVFLNASFFRIYHNIATNDLQRALIIQEGEEILDEQKQSAAGDNSNRGSNAASNANTAGSTNSNSGGNINANVNANAGNTNSSVTPTVNPTPTPAATPTPAPTPDEPGVTMEEINEQREVIEDYVEAYEGFGFSPLTWEQVKTWSSRLVAPPSSKEWWTDRRHDLITILGWSVMVLLLSVGAPFW
ncbi:MAG TPA: hypothetical protein VF658_18985 [Pyrinomonadaceae bacterium]|jgi:hypothetical protein